MNDWFQRIAVLHLLQLHSQVFVDMAQTLVSNMGLSVEGYRDSVRKLKELKLIDEDEMRFLLAVVGFRNVLIHEYARVNLVLVDRILRGHKFRKVLEIALKIREKAGNY